MTDINNNRADVAIAYRIYPGVSKVPPVHKDNKYKLSELCLASLKSSLGSLNVKIWALLDGCPPEYEDLFRKYFNSNELEIIKLEGIGNAGTFNRQLEILSNQDYSENIYFAEDDYFYLPDTFELMLELLTKRQEVDFVSPFDHLDYYNLKLHKHKINTLKHGDRDWRESATTCMTFLTTKEKLKETESIFRTYLKGNYDASIWLGLTKYKIFDPLFYFHGLFQDFLMFKILGKAWLFSATQIIAGERHKLFTPLPSIATHMDSECLAPGIDWADKFQKADIK